MENNERRSMAHYVQAEHAKTRERLAKRVVFPVPQVGDIIVYNEIRRYQDRHDCLPKRGVGIVKAVYGCNIIIDKLHNRGYFFNASVRTIDFELGLYQYVRLKKLPEEFPSYMEMNIFGLGDELRKNVVLEKIQDVHK